MVGALTGCSRRQYRVQADQEAYGLVAEKAFDPRWSVQDFTIEPSGKNVTDENGTTWPIRHDLVAG